MAVTSCPHSVDISSVCSIYSVSTVACVDRGWGGAGCKMWSRVAVSLCSAQLCSVYLQLLALLTVLACWGA